MALKAAPHVSWYRTARGGMYAFGAFVALIAVFMVLRAFGIGPFGSLLASGRLQGARAASCSPTSARRTRDSTLGRVVSDAVRAGLVGSSAFTLVPPATIAAALAAHAAAARRRAWTRRSAREIAVREGVKAIVDGDVTGVRRRLHRRRSGSCAPTRASSSRRSARRAMGRAV